MSTENSHMTVDFAPDVLPASVDSWRKATEMEITLADQFKIHFMERLRALLEGFVNIGRHACLRRSCRIEGGVKPKPGRMQR
jgi:hypothetical protein